MKILKVILDFVVTVTIIVLVFSLGRDFICWCFNIHYYNREEIFNIIKIILNALIKSILKEIDYNYPFRYYGYKKNLPQEIDLINHILREIFLDILKYFSMK